MTHGYVVAETISVVRRRFGVEAAARLLDELLPALRIVDVDADFETAGFALVS